VEPNWFTKSMYCGGLSWNSSSFVRSTRKPRLTVSVSVIGTPKPTAAPVVSERYCEIASEVGLIRRW
jgi:hypothetical protein